MCRDLSFYCRQPCQQVTGDNEDCSLDTTNDSFRGRPALSHVACSLLPPQLSGEHALPDTSHKHRAAVNMGPMSGADSFAACSCFWQHLPHALTLQLGHASRSTCHVLGLQLRPKLLPLTFCYSNCGLVTPSSTQQLQAAQQLHLTLVAAKP